LDEVARLVWMTSWMSTSATHRHQHLDQQLVARRLAVVGRCPQPQDQLVVALRVMR
jgi:hypothetical protein